MTMWIIILIVALIGIIVASCYIINRITKFRFIDYIEDRTIYKNKPRTTGKGADFGLPKKGEEKTKEKYKKSWLRRLIAFLIVLVTVIILILCFSVV